VIKIVVATRQSEDTFAKTWLGRSMPKDGSVSLVAAYDNKRGLSEVYNEAIDKATPDDRLVFCHDDVWIFDKHFVERVERALDRFDVFGVCGCINRSPKQVVWFSGWGTGAKLSGSVAFVHGGHLRLTEYGSAPEPVVLLDGLLIGARADKLKATGARFDAQFRYHFYDLDFSRAAEAAGLSIGTWPIAVAHESWGNYDSDEWRNSRDAYLAKWEKDA
jgi:GT2 family glycosyltransferase